MDTIKPDMDGEKVKTKNFRNHDFDENTAHAYWDMDFCSFTFTVDLPAESGVYAFYVGNELKYVGSTKNLAQRLKEYRRITLGTIKRSGIATNCHVNGEIYQALSLGQEVSVYICKTDKQKAAERRLRWKLKPEWNRQL